VPDLTKTIKLVGYGEQRMAQQHSWPGESHDIPGLSFSCRFVAVNWTVSTGWFVFSVGTFLQPQPSVVQELLACRAQGLPGSVVVSIAIDANHLGHRQRLSIQALTLAVHVFLYHPT